MCRAPPAKRARSVGVVPAAADICEEDVGILVYAAAHSHSDSQLIGCFQQRYADFHVREINDRGEAVRLRSCPTAREAAGLPQGCEPRLADSAAPQSAAPSTSQVVHFHMYKENRTTADALQQLSDASRAPMSAFAVCGTKDRRAITVQRVSARGVSPSRVCRINEKWGGPLGTNGSSRVRVGDFVAAERALTLAESRGNQFVVILREITLEMPRSRAHDHEQTAVQQPATQQPATLEATHQQVEARCEKALSTLRAHGFVNYFGLQRFGKNGAAPSHMVGAALLRGQVLRALRLILHPDSPGLKSAVREAYEGFARDAGAASAALGALPTRGCAMARRVLSTFVHARADGAGDEGAATAALRVMPRRLLLLMLNAFQAFVFNCAASSRLGHGVCGMRHAPAGRDARRLEGDEAPKAVGQTSRERVRPGDLIWASTAAARGVAAVAGVEEPSGEGSTLSATSDVLLSLADLAAAQDDEPERDLEAETPAGCEGDGGDSGGRGDSGDRGECGDRGDSGDRGETTSMRSQTCAAPLPPPVYTLTEADAASGLFSLEDVLIPLPGHAVTYPGNAAAAACAEVLASHGMRLDLQRVDAGSAGARENSPDGLDPALNHSLPRWCVPGWYDLPGGYRPLLAKPDRLESRLVRYTDHTKALEASDIDHLARHVTAPAPSPQVTEETAGSRLAWCLSFELPSSAYATMLLRELLHSSIESAEMKRRSKLMLTDHYRKGQT